MIAVAFILAGAVVLIACIYTTHIEKMKDKEIELEKQKKR